MSRPLALLWSVTFFTMGCGASQAPPTTATQPAVAEARPLPLDPWAFLPEDSFAVVDVQLDRLRDSAPLQRLISTVEEMFTRSDEYDRDAQLLLDVLKRTDRVLVGFSSFEQERFVVVLQGPFEEGELESRFREYLKEDLRPVEAEGFRGIGDHTALLLRVDERTYVFGETQVLRGGGLARAKSRLRPSLLSDPVFARLAERVGLGARSISFLSSIPQEAATDLDDLLSDHSDEVLGVSGGIDTASGLRADIALLMNAASSAESLVEEVRAELLKASDEPALRAFGLKPILERVQVASEGNEAHGSLQLDDGELGGMVDQLLGLLDLAEGGGTGP